MSEEGWIKIYRQMKEKAIWKSSTAQQKVILITLLLMADHKSNEWEWKGKKFKTKPGQMITSLESIRLEAGDDITIQNVRTALAKFEKYGFLTNKSTKTGRLITIVNWGIYQANNEGANKGINKELTKTSQSSNKELTPNKNVRIKENIYNSDFEEIWNLYPRKEGKAGARKSYEKLRKKYSKEELIRCVNRYASKVADTEKKYIKQGSTFFNGGYEDYLDTNYKESAPEITNPAYKPFEYD